MISLGSLSFLFHIYLVHRSSVHTNLRLLGGLDQDFSVETGGIRISSFDIGLTFHSIAVDLPNLSTILVRSIFVSLIRSAAFLVNLSWNRLHRFASSPSRLEIDDFERILFEGVH